MSPKPFSMATSKPSGSKTKKACVQADKEFDQGDGPNKGAVVGSVEK